MLNFLPVCHSKNPTAKLGKGGLPRRIGDNPLLPCHAAFPPSFAKGTSLNDFVSILLRIFFLLLALSLGALFFGFFLMLAVGLALVWGGRRLWAKVTGKPVEPWVFQFDPRAGFRRAYGSVWSKAPPSASARRYTPDGRLTRQDDITDVTPKSGTQSG